MDAHIEVCAMDSACSGVVGEAGRRHILLVEDDEAASAAYGQVLRSAGYEVSTARDFRLALEILEADRPLDLLLVDIVMPGSVNGLALSRMARMRRKHLKVIYMTGYSIPGADREALGPILFKPIDHARLISEIEQALTTD
jgi:DNA-binding NtrC family response regulator